MAIFSFLDLTSSSLTGTFRGRPFFFLTPSVAVLLALAAAAERRGRLPVPLLFPPELSPSSWKGDERKLNETDEWSGVK